MRHILAALVLALFAVDTSSAQPAVTTTTTHDTLQHSIVVAAPRAEVWALWTTSEGFASWAAPVAHVDLKQGGMIESNYNSAAHIGDAGNIRNRVLAYLPGEMLAIQVAQAPPGFPHADLVGTLFTVITLADAGPNATRISVSMIGFQPGDGYDALRTFFARGNAYTLEKLAARVTQGPTDWRTK